MNERGTAGRLRRIFREAPEAKYYGATYRLSDIVRFSLRLTIQHPVFSLQQLVGVARTPRAELLGPPSRPKLEPTPLLRF
eukprot:scaffold34787_cov19-Prasinocladus_malaysianus.AAC.1